MTESYAVFLGPTRVGHLAERRDRRWAFQFLASYRQRSDRPVLGQSFEDDLEKTYFGKKPGRLPAFFEHLLPEGRLRRVLERSLGLEEASDVELLAAVSRDIPGAVSLVSDERADVDGIEEGADTADAPPRSSRSGALRFSLGGAQLKFSMLKDEQGRFTVPAHGARGDWIVKIAFTGYEGLAANEFAILTWARAAGFDVPDVEVVRPGELGNLQAWVEPNSFALASRRYDRDGPHRIHQEDFAQVISIEPRADGSEKYHQTYDNLIKLTRNIVGNDGAEEMLQRIAFVVAAGNADAHLKNWSLIYRNRVRAELAPLYDQVATIAWPTIDRELALKLAGSREFGRVRLDSFEHIARISGLDVQRARQMVQGRLATIRSVWPSALAAGLPESHTKALRLHWKQVPLLRDVGDLP